MRETWLPAGANRVFERPGAKWIALMAAGLVGVALLAAAYGSGNSGTSTVASPATAGSCRNFLTADDLSPARRFEDPLPIPNRLQPQYRKSDGTPVWVVHARAYTWKPAPGVCIPKWGYEDGTPGPTLVIRPHEHSEFLVYNELPQSLYNPYVDPFNQLSWVAPAPSPIRTYYTVFGEPSRPPPAPFNAPPYAQSQYELSTALTVHLHGGHQGPADDGYPMDTFGPGESHLYDYPNNQEATTLWYHDHDMDHTRGHVLMGLAGFYLIDDAKADAKLGLPSGGRCERNAAAQTNAKASVPYFPTPAPSTTQRTVPTKCRDVPIMFQQIPAELLQGTEFQPLFGNKRHASKSPRYRSVWTANGTLAPFLTVTNKPYRFRFLNGNDEEPLKIWTTTKPDDPTSFARDAYLQQVGTDGGLMNYVYVDRASPRRTKIRLFPAQRADVVIDFSKVRTKTTFYLQAQPQQAFVGGTRRSCLTRLCPFGDAVARTARPLIEFVVVPTVGTKPQAFAPPRGRLRGPRFSSPIKKLSTKTSTGRKVTERTFLFGFDGHVGRNPFATINGRFFTPTHSYATPVLNTTEIWHLVNSTDGYHPIHIHDIEFQVMSRKRCPRVKKNADGPSTAYDWCGKRLSKWTNIQPEPGDWSSCTAKRCELAWKDVFVIPPYSEVTIIGKFTDNLGLYVFHCHNLIHEDAGMMAQFEVVNARSSPARASARRRTAAMPAMPGMPAMAGTVARR